MQLLTFTKPLALAGALALWAAAAPASAGENGWLAKASTLLSPPMSQNAVAVADEWQHTVAKVQAIAKNGQAGALAATVSAEGHWTFANGIGELFIAANDREMATVADVLLPDGTGPRGLTLYLTPLSVFVYRHHLKALPAEARLQLVIAGHSYPLQAGKSRAGKDSVLYAPIRPNVVVEISKRKLFEETIWRLEQPLPQDVRVLSILTEGPASLPVRPPVRFEAGERVVEYIAAARLVAALPALSGQPILLTGRLGSRTLTVRTQSGGEIELDIEKIRLTAAAHDIELILLNSKAPRQPGVRNWLFLKVDIDGLSEALMRERFADFIDALAASKVEVRGRILPGGRLRLSIASLTDGFLAPANGLVGSIAELASEAVGTVLLDAVQMDMPDRARAMELSWRLLPWLPVSVQTGLAALFAAGLLSVRVVWRWWAGIWPPEMRHEYGTWFGYQAARGVRILVFGVLFLPIAGLPALVRLTFGKVFVLAALPFSSR